jgi:hypothetical protein
MNHGLSGLDDLVANHPSLVLLCVGFPLLCSLWIVKKFLKESDDSGHDEEEEECAHENRAGISCSEKRPLSASVISSSSCQLLSLDEELIGTLWPRGWIIEGMEASLATMHAVFATG